MFRELDKKVSRALGAIRQAFRAVIGTVDSGPGVQLASGGALAGEDLRDNELFQQYGFTSRPPAGTMGIVVPIGGKTSHGVIVATENAAYRIVGLADGELAIYTKEGTRIVMKQGRTIETECDVYRLKCKVFEVVAEQSSTFDTPVLKTSAEAVVEGKLTGNGGMALSGAEGDDAAAQITGTLRTTDDVIARTVSLRGHKHPVPTGGTSDTPIA